MPSSYPSLAALGLLLLGGCAAPLKGSVRPAGQPVDLSPPPHAAKVVFVRPDSFVGSAVSIIYFDLVAQRVLGKSVNDSVFAVELAPGDYLLCGIPTAEYSLNTLTPEQAAMGYRTPATRLTVAAAKTYLLQVSLRFGGRIEALPVRPGTEREARIISELAYLRQAEPVPDAEELKALEASGLLTEWSDLCRDSSSDDLRLHVGPDDGR